VVELELRDFVLGGVGLEGEAKERFNAIQQQLAQLSTKFSNNVLDATKVGGWVGVGGTRQHGKEGQGMRRCKRRQEMAGAGAATRQVTDPAKPHRFSFLSLNTPFPLHPPSLPPPALRR
jgi:Zn-dependent oligopeptidase